MSAVTPLLATKLYVPRARPASRLVRRSRLVERLNATGPFTLICAPAGFGKTTLLGEWINQRDEGGELRNEETLHPSKVAWVSLDDGDNDPARFWSYVIAALQTLKPDLGADAKALLQSPQPPPIQSILIVLLNDIATFHERFSLVLVDVNEKGITFGQPVTAPTAQPEMADVEPSGTSVRSKKPRRAPPEKPVAVDSDEAE